MDMEVPSQAPLSGEPNCSRESQESSRLTSGEKINVPEGTRLGKRKRVIVDDDGEDDDEEPWDSRESTWKRLRPMDDGAEEEKCDGDETDDDVVVLECQEGVSQDSLARGASRSRPRVCPSSDETIMKLVLEERRRLSPTDNIPRSVLDTIAASLTSTGESAFKNGASLMCRVTWLSTVRLNPNHAEFSNITGSLRDLIDEYRRLREPTGDEMSEAIREFDSQRVVSAGFGQIDQMYDETMMRILLQLRFFKPKLNEDEAWGVVAISLQDMFGSELPDEYTTEDGIKKRVTWLETVVKTRSHRFHSDMPSGLRDLMTEYVQLRNEVRARKEAEGVDSDDDSSANECEDVCPQTPSRGIDPACDEAFVGLMLKFRPKARKTKRKEVWATIASEMKKKNLPYDSVGRVVSKATWLLKVARDPTHHEHRNLTPSLKKMLLTYDEIDFDRHRQPCRLPISQQSAHVNSTLVDDVSELQQSNEIQSNSAAEIAKDMGNFHAMVSRDCAAMKREIAELRNALTKKRSYFESRQSESALNHTPCPLNISWAQKWEQYQSQHRADQQAMMEIMRKERQEFLTMFQAESDRRHEEFESIINLVSQVVSKLRDA